VFPGLKAGTTCSNNAILKLLQQDLKRPDVTVHGFRTSFRSGARTKPTIAASALSFACTTSRAARPS
jgi:hypothetical protein